MGGLWYLEFWEISVGGLWYLEFWEISGKICGRFVVLIELAGTRGLWSRFSLNPNRN